MLCWLENVQQLPLDVGIVSGQEFSKPGDDWRQIAAADIPRQIVQHPADNFCSRQSRPVNKSASFFAALNQPFAVQAFEGALHRVERQVRRQLRVELLGGQVGALPQLIEHIQLPRSERRHLLVANAGQPAGDDVVFERQASPNTEPFSVFLKFPTIGASMDGAICKRKR